MKKFKLFAIATLLMGSVNAMAAYTWVDGQKSATALFTFQYLNGTTDGDVAKITGFVSELNDEFKTAVAIPDSVTDAVTKKRYHVVEIGASAFKDQPISTISFYAPKKTADNFNLGDQLGVKAIGAGAFEGTKIQTLDLSNTTITDVENMFGTVITWDGTKDTGKENKTLTSVTLPSTWTTIKTKAFENCTALATINFGKASAAQTINTLAFAGCQLTALDFTDTKVSAIPAKLLYDEAKFTNNTSLTTVTLTDQFAASAKGFNSSFANCTALTTVANLEKTAIVVLNAAVAATNPGEFEGCTALSSINTSKITTFGAKCFMGCAALTKVSIEAATTSLGDYAFSGTGIAEIKFKKGQFGTIPEGLFYQSGLKKVEWTSDDNALAVIKTKAFAGTQIEEIVIPATAPIDMTAADQIENMAFSACEKLKTVKWDKNVTPTAKYINANAFTYCSDVNFYTGGLQVTYFTTAGNEVKNVTFKDITAAPAGSAAKKLGLTYGENNGKYYLKMKATANIAIAKGDAKVYSAYIDKTNDDGSLNMICYKAVKGYYQIANGDVCLIISDKDSVEVAEGTGTSGSMAAAYGAPAQNALKLTANEENRLDLILAEAAALGVDDTYKLYCWVKKGGFKKITSGTTLPKNTLYALAKEPAGGRLIVNWYDEDGNLESETTAIQSIEAKAAENGTRYNLAGQKVNDNYKGIVIKNGKKVMMK